MSKMPVKTYFPDFVPNQILTNTQLNDLRKYLDEQNRLTRLRLVGTGIVCGLHASVDDSGTNPVVSISEGYGLTSDGFLIEIPATVFVAKADYLDPCRTRYILKDDPDDEEEIGIEVTGPDYMPWRLEKDEIDFGTPSGLPDDPPGNPVTQIPIVGLLTAKEAENDTASSKLQLTDFQEYVLVLYLEIQKQDLKSCLTTDCNNKGQNLNFVVKALLIKEEYLTAVEPCADWQNPAFVPRFHRALRQNGVGALENISDTDDINRAYGKIVSEVKDPLFQKISDAYANVNPFLQLNIDETALQTAWDNALPNGTNLADFNQYHYDFVKDVACAYNEFKAHYCKILDDCCPEFDFPRHLMIRDFNGNPEPFRHEFRPSPLRNVMHDDLKKAGRLFLRIVTLIQNFNLANTDKIKITPSQTEPRSLGEKAIPHYYKLPGTEVKNVWQNEPCCRDPRLLSYSENSATAGDLNDNDFDLSEYVNAPLETLIDKNGFFRIEGHLGMDCDSALSDLENVRKAFNLDFDVKLLHLDPAAGGGQIPEASEIMNIKGLLIETEKIRQTIEQLLMNDKGDSPEIKLARKKMMETLQKITAMNKKWIAHRISNRRHCDLTHVRADYLNVRSRVLCTYSKLKKMLDRLPDLSVWKSQKFVVGTSLSNVSGRRAAADARATELKANLADETLTLEKRNEFELELTKINAERASLARMETTLAIGSNIASKLTNRGLAGGAVVGPAGASPMEKEDFGDLVSQGMLFGILNLKTEVERLCELLPKDVKKFNYHLFIYYYKNLIISILQLKLLVSVFIDFLTLTFGKFQPFWRSIQIYALQWAGSRLAEITDYINCINRIQYNCFHAEFATVYYTLEYLLRGRETAFGDFAAAHPGMEHLAGVERGNTFLLVCGEVNGEREIVADFTLHASPGCCCDFDPGELCLPPVAMPDYKVIRIKTDEDETGVSELIDVLSNDYNLNEKENIKLSLPTSKSDLNKRNNGPDNLSIETDNNGKEQIRYTRDSRTGALDSFKYRLENPDCGLSDEGEVLVLIRPESEKPVIAQGDVAATSQNQPIDIDVALNDFGESIFIFDEPYTLSLPSPNTVFGGSVSIKTVTLNNLSRQVFEYVPPKDFVGRDTFFYEIETGNQKAGAQVTVLIVPCCKEGEPPTPPDLIVTGPKIIGVVTTNTGEPLVGTSLTVIGTSIGSVTDLNGNFSLQLPVGEQKVQFASGGFKSRVFNLKVQAGAPSATLKVVMFPTATGLVGLISTGDLANFTRAVFTGEDATRVDPNKVVIDTFTTRHSERVGTLGNFRDDAVIGTTEAFLKAETFLTKTMTDAGKSPEAIAAEYKEVTDELIDAHKLSSGETKAAYKALLETTTHAYMDKMIIKNPNEAEPTMKAELETATEKIKNEGISILGFKNRFGGGRLRADLNIGAITDLNRILR